MTPLGWFNPPLALGLVVASLVEQTVVLNRLRGAVQ